jgi:shikimate dehydrogenase
MTSPYAEVIGDPIAHSKSPLIHRFWLAKLGIEGDYRALQVTAAELGDYFAARVRDEHWRGCNITMPHKQAALGFVHKHRDPSFPVEPINIATLRRGRLEGLNSDTQGLLEPLMAAGEQLGRTGQHQQASPKPAVVFGSGGVLFAVMIALSTLGYAPIHVMVRDSGRAARIMADYEGVDARVLRWGDPLPSCELLVNATPLGMTGYPDFPFGVDAVAAGGIVFDMVYAPVETALLGQARGHGLRTVDGLQMLVAQAAVGFQLFFGSAAPRTYDPELRELLTQ